MQYKEALEKATEIIAKYAEDPLNKDVSLSPEDCSLVKETLETSAAIYELVQDAIYEDGEGIYHFTPNNLEYED